MPRPPAWVTAAASLPPAAEPIGASRLGCVIPSRRVSAVSMVAIGASRLALGRQLVLCPQLEVAGVMAFMELVRRIALQAVDDASPLDGRAIADQVGPALDVLVVADRQEIARANHQALCQPPGPMPTPQAAPGWGY